MELPQIHWIYGAVFWGAHYDEKGKYDPYTPKFYDPEKDRNDPIWIRNIIGFNNAVKKWDWQALNLRPDWPKNHPEQQLLHGFMWPPAEMMK
jgi:hypothetical protein